MNKKDKKVYLESYKKYLQNKEMITRSVVLYAYLYVDKNKLLRNGLDEFLTCNGKFIIDAERGSIQCMPLNVFKIQICKIIFSYYLSVFAAEHVPIKLYSINSDPVTNKLFLEVIGDDGSKYRSGLYHTEVCAYLGFILKYSEDPYLEVLDYIDTFLIMDPIAEEKDRIDYCVPLFIKKE